MFFSCVNIVSANVVINKVNLEPVGERYIKLYNNSSSAQDLTGWSIKRKSSGGIEYSLLSSSRLDGKIIEGNNYLLLVNEDTYIGGLTPDATWAKSYTFSDKNTILLYNQNDELVDSFYVSADTSNNDTSGDTSSEEPNTTENVSSVSLVKENPDILKITTKIISPKVVVAGIPFNLSSLTTTNRKEIYQVGKFVWNFGDGGEGRVGNADPFTYAYEYPGDYVLSLSYFDNSFNKIADATNKINIKVIPSEIYINSVGNSIDPYVEIGNKSDYEIDLSGWVLSGVTNSFSFPDGTTILKGNKIKLSPKITKFTSSDIEYITITNPNKNIVATYPIQKKQIIQNNYVYDSIPATVRETSINNQKENIIQEESNVINLNDLEANASQDGNLELSNSAYAFIGLFVVISIGIISFLLIRKRNKGVPDYIDREVNADDIKILE